MSVSKKLSCLLLAMFATMALSASAMAAEGDITIFYTNDVHTYIDNAAGEGNESEWSYSKVAALKDSVDGALLVDAGDHVQGTAFGGMDTGATIISLMNAAGYDAATLGNHEFDYGMERCLELTGMAAYPYTSSNFYHEQNGVAGERVLSDYVVLEAAGKKIALIGITTPESFTKSTPAYFQDANGNYIYGIAGGEDGAQLYAAVQSAIDKASAEADYVIALGHLGIDLSSRPWTSYELIANTKGLDAFIDGHSHSSIAMENVTDAAGNAVVLTQTGSYLDAVGKMTIAADGSISTELLSGDMVAAIVPDAEVKAIEDAWISEINEKLGQVIGYSEVTFDNYDAEGKRLVRKQSTNSGIFAADALYYLFDNMDMDVDVAIMNGGGVRNKTISGEISYLTCKEIHTFGNVACLQTVTGQALLDALEWGVHALTADGAAETGGFLHASGLRYTIDLSVPSTVQIDDKGVWAGGPTGAYRIQNVEVRNNETGAYEPLDLAASYNLAGYNYTLRNQGDGFNMFKDAINVLDYVSEDYMVLANYVSSFPVSAQTGLPTIAAGGAYDSITGDGRVTIVGLAGSEEPVVEPVTPEVTPEVVPEVTPEVTEPTGEQEYTVVKGDTLWKIAGKMYGSGAKWSVLYKANSDQIKNPDIISIGQVLRVPAA